MCKHGFVRTRNTFWSATLEVPDETTEIDRILCECDIEPLRELVVELEANHQVNVSRPPSICLTMIPAEDSLEKQKFFLGEALTTECEVLVDQKSGYGLCLGDEPVRTYCMAVIDAFVHSGCSVPAKIETFLHHQQDVLARRQQEEFDLILQTQVDFKLMEEE
jgi:phosphonate C-P lyase system protein PhnG